MQSQWKGVNTLKRFDAFSKPLEDYRIKTVTGAIVTMVSSIIIIILFMSELNYFLTTEKHQELFVDTSRGQKMSIKFDVVFPHLACEYLSLDAMDVSGAQQIDVDHEIYKTRLNLQGEVISDAVKHEIVIAAATNTTAQGKTPKKSDDPNYCGSCYGAETTALKCCNTCEQVRDAYRARGWALVNVDNIEQCRDDGWAKKIKEAANEGCRMSGTLQVNKVAGNFHFAPGKSFTQSHVHVHDMQSFGKTDYNVTHRIVSLTFGDEYPGAVNPLNNHSVIVEKMSQMYTYYIKIVPTTYINLDRTVLNTNQFSVTRHMRATALSGGTDGLPGVFFTYEISPMLVRIAERQRSLFQFLTNVCAIIGGVFTVSSLIDAFIYHSSCAIQRKLDAGKAS